MTCEHGFIGACSECDGAGQVPETQPSYLSDLAECGVCGRNKRVCCDDGYAENEDGTTTHVGAVCVDCCHGHRGSIWDGKSVAGGTYSRCE